jgi:hypothetical protein
LGMYHESLTDCCVMYYNRLPAEVDADVAVVLEPVVGSGVCVRHVGLCPVPVMQGVALQVPQWSPSCTF